MRQPLQIARWLGLMAAGASLGFVLVPVAVFAMGVINEASPSCYDCPPIPLADGMWFALLFSLIGFFATLRITPNSRDAPVFMAAGGTGLLVTGLVISVRGMASPHGEAVVWALAGAALVGAAAVVFIWHIGRARRASEPPRKS